VCKDVTEVDWDHGRRPRRGESESPSNPELLRNPPPIRCWLGRSYTTASLDNNELDTRKLLPRYR
jgi:hypothetical protein